MDGTRRSSSRRDFLKLAGASSMAALLAACGGGTPAAAPTAAPAAAGGASGAPAGDTTATLTIFDFGGDADKKIYADAHARFKQKFPNVTIADNFTPVGTWSEYSNKITTQMAGGQSPDIINIAIEGARLLVKKGLLQPLDEFSANDASA
ncbi:MAG: extracellular solute-binding protein, partial [Chloroflexota bacterium]|nr:extracellular solute-binding protein [Chloroflexota bacterium]